MNDLSSVLEAESVDQVLDDNKMLCLNNGERIKLAPTMTMMFEVRCYFGSKQGCMEFHSKVNDLAVASPATVSRCGMVLIEPVHLGWRAPIDTWKEVFSIAATEVFSRS